MSAIIDHPVQQLVMTYRDAFQFYIAQDAHFLAAFCGAYQSALKKAAKAGDWNAEEVLGSLLHGVSKELELHTSYAKVLQINSRPC